MTVLWLLIWVCCGTPELHMWNAWSISLAACVAIDLTEGA